MSTQTLLTDLIILAIFGAAVYSFLVLPRRREFRKRQAFVSTLQVGARVTTYGGLLGTITSVDHEAGLVTVQIAEGVEVQMLGAAIVDEYDPDAIAESVRRATGS